MLSRGTRGLSGFLIRSTLQVVQGWKGFSKSTKASARVPRNPPHPQHHTLHSSISTGDCSCKMGQKPPGQFGAQMTLMQNDNSSSGLFWALPRYQHVNTTEGSWAPGRTSPTSLHSPAVYT